MEGLSDRDWEKLYKVLTVIRNEFLEVDDEARYYTESWIAAEREATEEYKRGGLRSFKSVQERLTTSRLALKKTQSSYRSA
jgi:hypothetical protein